jgi:hypothetical protein
LFENLPREDLDVLLDVARLRVGERHDDLEELFTLRLGLGNSLRMESLEIPTNTVLLLHTEPARGCNKLLE